VKRLINILGRGGTTLIAICIALLLVSLLPPVQMNGHSSSTNLDPVTFTPLRIFPPPFESFYNVQLTPQRELEMEFITTGNATVYLLTLDSQTILDWISEQQQIDGRDYNLTSLDEFLEVHQDLIGWERELYMEEIQYTYAVEKITNATILLANPSSDDAIVVYNLKLVSSLAPSEKVRTIAYFVAPIGVVLAMPWLLDSWKQRKKK